MRWSLERGTQSILQAMLHVPGWLIRLQLWGTQYTSLVVVQVLLVVDNDFQASNENRKYSSHAGQIGRLDV